MHTFYCWMAAFDSIKNNFTNKLFSFFYFLDQLSESFATQETEVFSTHFPVAFGNHSLWN